MENNNQMPKHPEPYWRESTDLPTFPKLTETIKTDVAIVGAGITGITAAYLLSQHGVKVTLIDSDEVLNGTTGHTTAKVTAQHGLIYDELIQNFGEEKAKLHYQANKAGMELIEDTIKKLNIDCAYEKQDAYLYTNDPDYKVKLENEMKAYEKIGIKGALQDTMPLEVPMQSALVMADQAQFHPLSYLKALLEESVRNGVQVFEQTPAAGVEYNKHPAVITKDGHRIVCRYVIVATHYPFYDGLGFFPVRLTPERSYVIAVKTPKKYPGGMYINTETPKRSIRTIKDKNGEDLWLIGGEEHKTGQGKPTLEYYKELQDFAETNFGIDAFEYRWSAQDLVSLDKLPYIGRITKAQESVYVATGYRKWGMTQGTIAAKHITDLILNEETPYTLLYSPSRFEMDPSLGKLISGGADVTKHLIKGKFDFTNENIDEIKTDEAIITRINGKRAGVYKDLDNKLHKVDTKCTHMGCEVGWNQGERTWDCPCHGSRFSYTGEVMEGPAKDPLKKFE